MDWLDLGFNAVIGGVVLFIAAYWGIKLTTAIRKKLGEENEEELDNLLKAGRAK